MPVHSYQTRQLAYALPKLPIPGYEPPRTRSRYVVWSGSTTEDVRFVPVSKKHARVWYQKARAWDRRSKAFGRHGGGIGLTAMAVLHCFHFDFLNYTTGRLDPSYEGIARMTGLARSTVAAAIARLKRLGIINWVRRCAKTYEGGIFTLRQETNAYAVLPPSHWRGYVEPDAAPAPWPETWGAAPPMPGLLAQTMTAVGDGAPLARQAGILDADPGDELATALARLARSLGASNA
jgi:hypothetical protein